VSHDPDRSPDGAIASNARSTSGRVALDVDALRGASWTTIAVVVIAGGTAASLFHLTLPAITDALAPVFEATGGLVEVTLLASPAFVLVIVGGTILRFLPSRRSSVCRPLLEHPACGRPEVDRMGVIPGR
jgi:hypothetical protein